MSSKLILLVEDNPDDVDLTMRAFKRNNINADVIVLQDGQKAIDYISNLDDSSKLPDVIFLDLKLPKKNGLDVLDFLRNQKKTKIPVVILTSSVEESDLINAYSLGANSYIRKPVDFHQFIDHIQTISRYWLTLNQSYPNFVTGS
jgi:DNA-binding response OmpR family regulator